MVQGKQDDQIVPNLTVMQKNVVPKVAPLVYNALNVAAQPVRAGEPWNLEGGGGGEKS